MQILGKLWGNPKNHKDMQIFIFKKMHFFSPSIRISRKSINFNDKKILKSNFYKNKKLFKIDDIDAYKILASKKNHMVQKDN